MKKNYKTPVVDVIKIATTNMIAGSNVNNSAPGFTDYDSTDGDIDL